MPPQQVLQMYRTMLRIRAFEQAAGKAFDDGRIRGPVHQSVGQEAIAAGVCASLRRTDYIASHRGHGHAIAKGVDIGRMMKELLGREGGICGGKGGSMHIADFSVGMLGANGVLADGVTIAVGAAQAVKLLRQDRIVVVFFGDGAVNRGPLLEAINWAVIYTLPVLFVCEDHAASARSFGIPSESIDGNDVVAVHEAAERWIARIRRGDGPALIHATGAGDPLERCRNWLLRRASTDKELDRLRSESEALVDKALQEAEAAPLAALREAFSEIQDLGAETWPR